MPLVEHHAVAGGPLLRLRQLEGSATLLHELDELCLLRHLGWLLFQLGPVSLGQGGL